MAACVQARGGCFWKEKSSRQASNTHATRGHRGGTRQTVPDGGRGEAAKSRDVAPRGPSHRLGGSNGAKQDKASRNAIARCQAGSKSVAPGETSNPEHHPPPRNKLHPSLLDTLGATAVLTPLGAKPGNRQGDPRAEGATPAPPGQSRCSSKPRCSGRYRCIAVAEWLQTTDATECTPLGRNARPGLHPPRFASHGATHRTRPPSRHCIHI
jgi:hypothetical protein